MAQALLDLFEKFEDNSQQETVEQVASPSPASVVEINQSFPRQPTIDNLINMIEYRIKIMCTNNEIFESGQTKKIETNIRITRKPGRLSLLLKPADNLELRLISEGFISPMLRGKIPVELQNPSPEGQHLPSGTVVGYLILTPFISH